MMIALLCMVVQTAWAEWEGSRTQANQYQISSVANRNTLATNVEAGNNNPTDLSSIKQSEIFSVTISVVTEKNVLALIDGTDNTDMIEKYDGQIAEVTYDREFSAIDNGDGTWTPRCYTICLPYDFNLYDQVKSGQASFYRLKYVDGEKGQFIFTNDFGFASAGMGWLLVVNQGSISLNVAAATITAQTKSEEVYGYQGPGIRPSIRTIETDGTSRYFDLHGRHIGKKPVS